MKNVKNISTLFKNIEAQQKALSQMIKNSAKSKTTKIVEKVPSKLPATVIKIPAAALNKSSMVITILLNLFKTVFKLWIHYLNKIWFFKILISTLSFIFWLIWKLIKVFGYIKYLRSVVLFIAFLLGLNLDIEHLNWSMLSIYSFFSVIFDKLIDNVISLLTRFTQWLYRIQVGRFQSDIKYPELVDHPTQEISHNDLMARKSDLKTKLFEALDIKEQTPWYKDSRVWLGVGAAIIVVAGAGIYYFYFYNDKPAPIKPGIPGRILFYTQDYILA